MAKWQLSDSSGSMSFAINPNEATMPSRTTKFTTNETVAPNGQRLRFQGISEAPQITFSGACLTQAFYTDLDTWAQKRHPLTLTDDLGNSWDIVIKDWKFTRLHRHSYPWRIDYSATVEVL